ncbi:MAG: AbrB/MazE/SpoVT family DNA-binding domain-containing protein [Candidatus Bathyarchaeia archaeon]
MIAGTTRLSSRGQVVIPEPVRMAVKLREGDELLVVVIGDAIVMKKLASVTFEEVARPIWRAVKEMGLSGKEVDELIEEAKTETRSRH